MGYGGEELVLRAVGDLRVTARRLRPRQQAPALLLGARAIDRAPGQDGGGLGKVVRHGIHLGHPGRGAGRRCLAARHGVRRVRERLDGGRNPAADDRRETACEHEEREPRADDREQRASQRRVHQSRRDGDRDRPPCDGRAADTMGG